MKPAVIAIYPAPTGEEREALEVAEDVLDAFDELRPGARVRDRYNPWRLGTVDADGWQHVPSSTPYGEDGVLVRFDDVQYPCWYHRRDLHRA